MLRPLRPTRPLRVLSLYEGFFAGGARILHTDAVAGLHASGRQQHRVLSIAAQAVRDASVQSMRDDPRYLRLRDAGVEVTTLGRTAESAPPARDGYSLDELLIAQNEIARADVVLSLKEQPVGLLLALRDHGMLPDVPIAACLHRSDPTHSGPALGWLAEAAATGVVDATISCASSTSDAYARAGVHAAQRLVIANGIDTARFRPGSITEVERTRRSLGIPRHASVVVFAARFDAMKDPGLFLRAVAAHRRLRPDTHYVMCGAGMTTGNPLFTELVASEAGGSHRIHALGIRDDMPSIYQVADIVALTSAFGEASPLCLIEGTACGATPVTTDVGDARLIAERAGGLTPRDPLRIAQTWEHILQRRVGYRRLAVAARPVLGRERMIDEYRSAVELLAVAEVAAA